MQTMTKLEKLELTLKKNKAPVLQHFNPGLPRQEVESFLKSHGINSISSLVALYEWHNGVKTVYGFLDPELEILPFGKLFNMQDMVEMRQVFREWAYEDFADLDNYIPLLGSGESDMYILNLTTEEILRYQPMIQVYGELTFRSIDQMTDCIIECFEKGAFKIEEDGFNLDFSAYRLIQRRHLAETPS